MPRKVRDDDASSSDDSSDSDMDPEETRVINPRNLLDPKEAIAAGIRLKSAQEMEEDDDYEEDVDETGRKVFTRSKPYLGAIEAPTTQLEINPDAPDEDLVLDHVYGYSTQRDCLAMNTKGEIVYPAAGIVVTYNPKTDDQRYFFGHNDDVSCLASHENEPDIVATGQVATIVDRRARPPRICVHNTRTGESWTLENAAQRLVRSLDFSPCGKYIASVGGDDDNTVTVWDWKAGKKVASQKCDTNKVLHLRWSHCDEDTFVTVGKRSIWFWTWDGAQLKKSRGKLGKFKTSTFPCVGFSEKGYACVGTKDGRVLVFVGSKCKKQYKLHKGAVYTVDWYAGGLISGGKDGKIQVLDKKVKPVHTIDIGAPVRCVKVDGDDMLVGSGKAEIRMLEDFLTKPKLGESFVNGHWDGELWAVDESPNGVEFVTAGEENMIAVWNSETHKLARQGILEPKRGKKSRRGGASTTSRHPPNQCARAVSWSPKGDHIAVGTNDGMLLVFDAATLDRVAAVDLNKHGKRKVKGQKNNWIEALSYSPDGKTVAVGTHGIVVCLCDATQGYRVEGTLKAHNAAITHLDWSADGQSLQTNCRAYELLFHDIDSNKLSNSEQNTSSRAFKDTNWETQSCILGWAVQGVYDPGMDGTDINTVSVNRTKTLIATGDDFGYVNLYRFPVPNNGHKKRAKGGHSSHVMGVHFSNDGKRLYTVGGGDKAILQWDVVKA